MANPGESGNASHSPLLTNPFSLTGESKPQQKFPSCKLTGSGIDILELQNVLLSGTNVVSGHGLALVVKTGDGMKIFGC